MADYSESDYSMGDYSAGLYSYKPVESFASAHIINVYVDSPLKIYGFRQFSANIYIDVRASGHFGIQRDFHSEHYIPITVQSFEYIGWFWDPNYAPPDYNDLNNPPWVPDAPTAPIWVAEQRKIGPWKPWGPDMTPNYEGDYNG